MWKAITCINVNDMLRSANDIHDKVAGAGQAGQAKTGPLLSALGLVMIVNCIDRLVKIVT